MLCVPRSSLESLPWDISIRHLIAFLDGCTFVKRLAARDANMDPRVVRKCLRTLLHYGCVVMSDVLRLSNVYQLTSSGRALLLLVAANCTATATATATANSVPASRSDVEGGTTRVAGGWAAAAAAHNSPVLHEMLSFAAVDAMEPVTEERRSAGPAPV